MNALLLAIPKEVYPSELGAAFLSALAYPEDTGQRNRFAAAMLGVARDENLKSGLPVPLGIGWLLSQMDRQQLNIAFKSGFGKIERERLIAAKMAFPKVHAAFCDVAGVSRPEDVPGSASEEMIAAVGVDLEKRRSNRGRRPIGGAPKGNKGNVLSRQWKPTLPVLHLALSYHFECAEPAAAVQGLSLDDLFFDPACSERLIRRSIALQPIVRDLFQINAEEQFQFVYAN